MGSTAEIIAKLSSAVERLEQAQSTAAKAADEADSATGIVNDALSGSTPGQLIGVIKEAAENIRAAGRSTDRATSQINETIARVKSLGN